LTTKVWIETGRDVQNGGLAAAGRADQRTEGKCIELQSKIANDFDRVALGRNIRLRIDADFKRPCGAIGSCVVQAVAPGMFQWRA